MVLLWSTRERNRIMAQHNSANIPSKETMELEAFPDVFVSATFDRELKL